jgi:hypothetical protein
MAATLHDVARPAGVSISDQSRTSSTTPYAPDHARNVERAIAELGYTPNLTARASAPDAPRWSGLRGVDGAEQEGPPPCRPAATRGFNATSLIQHPREGAAMSIAEPGYSTSQARDPRTPDRVRHVEAHTPAPTGGGVR